MPLLEQTKVIWLLLILVFLIIELVTAGLTTIWFAEGEAEAILKVQKANAQGLRFLKDAGADQAVFHHKTKEAAADPCSGSCQNGKHCFV